MQEKMKSISARDMHQYVFGLVGVLMAIAISYLIALVRVSQHEKFAGFHVKSLTLEGKLKTNQSVTTLNQTVNQIFPSEVFDRQSTPNIQLLKEDMAVNEITSLEEIKEPEQIKELNQKLYNQIARLWQAGSKLKQTVAYRVTVTAEGAIASYEPLLQPALDFLPETPLPELVKATTQGPIAQFKVVFTRQGILEVSPWHGWKKNR